MCVCVWEKTGGPVNFVGAQHEYHVLNVHWVGVTVIQYILSPHLELISLGEFMSSLSLEITANIHEQPATVGDPSPSPSPEQGPGGHPNPRRGSAETAAPKQLGRWSPTKPKEEALSARI